MMNPIGRITPLPLNFPQTFLPDRRLLGQLLVFANANGAGDKEAISAETGIPTGKSTGKVEPMIHFARGMGLIKGEKTQAVWRLSTTLLGRLVLQQDAFLSEPLTMWLLHLMLCRRLGRAVPVVGIADPWFVLFAEGRFRLGQRVVQSAFLRFLVERHTEKSYLKGLSALVGRMYVERASFGDASIMTFSENADGEMIYVLEAAPTYRAFFPAYSAYLYLIWDDLFGDVKQISFDELTRETRLLALLGWDDNQETPWLDWMADQGLVQLDRHTGDTVLLRLVETSKAISRLYSELV
jgi:hypothetical protein